MTLGSSIEGGNDPELSGPPLFDYFRSWDSGFFGPQLAAMPPDALSERALSEHEARALMQPLGIEERLAT